MRETVTQAMLQAPLFITRWRWVTSIALAIKRNPSGKRVPAQFQRMDAEDLIAVIFPDQITCQDNVVGEREIPDHPLVNQTITDCLTEAMDIDDLEKLLSEFEAGKINIHCFDLSGPSPFAHAILHARPYAFLDDVPAEERRTQAVAARNFANPADAAQLAKLDQNAIDQVRAEAWPSVNNADELHDALMITGFLRESEESNWQIFLEQLFAEQRATTLTVGQQRYWVASERLPLCFAIWPQANMQPSIQAAGFAAHKEWSCEEALIEIVRGRLECLGPVTETTLGQHTQFNSSAY